MSLNVFVIPENPRNDQYIHKPIVRALLDAIGKPNANVRICRNPTIDGVEDALDPATIRDVILTNPQVDLYVLLVDRDAEPHRHERMSKAERQAETVLRDRQSFVAAQAHQEAEVWLLAGQDDLPAEWNWADVRAEREAKEIYFDPYVNAKGLATTPGGGRKPLGETAGQNYASRIRALCDEIGGTDDIEGLEDRVDAVISA